MASSQGNILVWTPEQSVVVSSFFKCVNKLCSEKFKQIEEVESHYLSSVSCANVKQELINVVSVSSPNFKVIPRPLFNCSICGINFNLCNILIHFASGVHGNTFKLTSEQENFVDNNFVVNALALLDNM